MAAFLLFVLKSSFALALLVSLFMAFMSRETFHRLNRYLLLGIAVCALVLPAVNLGIESPLSRLIDVMSLARENLSTGMSLEDFEGFEFGNATMSSVVDSEIISTPTADNEPFNWLLLAFWVDRKSVV